MLLNIEYLLRYEDDKTGEIKYVEKLHANGAIYTTDRSKALHFDTEILAREARNQRKLQKTNPWPIKLN
jgi:hypothetical protein